MYATHGWPSRIVSSTSRFTNKQNINYDIVFYLTISHVDFFCFQVACFDFGKTVGVIPCLFICGRAARYVGQALSVGRHVYAAIHGV